MKDALTFAASRRNKWLVLLFWVVVFIGLNAVNIFDRYADAEQNRNVDYLPSSAESVEVLEQIEEFPSGERFAVVVVYRRDGGLTGADRATIAADRRELRRIATAGPPPPPTVSRNGTTALIVVPLTPTGEADIVTREVDRVREAVAEQSPSGVQVEITGAAGFAADAIDVFDSINSTLLAATGLLVFVLLILIYRSPIFWFLPFFSVVVAEVSSRGLGYVLSELGVTVTGQTSAILTVLVFGAGTDYALLIVARYREELRRQEDRHAAVATAMRTAGPAIVASAATVMAALLCLSLAEVTGTAGLALIGALAIGLAMLVMCTLLPALLAICGRRAFWPFIPRVGDEGADATHGVWRRIADRVGGRPRRVWIGSLAVLGVMGLGLTSFSTNLTTGNQFRDEESSTRGQDLIEQAFPGGATPNTVLVSNPQVAGDVRAALARRSEVAAVGRIEEGRPGARFDLVLKADPYSRTAFAQIPDLRAAARETGGDGVLIGGPTAEEHDLRESAERDNFVIVPLVLLVVFLVLALLLRALVLPVLLIATVVVSFVAAMGVGAFFFDYVFGFPGADPSLPLWAFVFLVALGIDYNIFLMARVREEATRYGTRHGMLRGLAVTGGVITSAGIVLAGTFSVLASLPLIFLTEIGFVIAFGVLLDTFVVRSVLVPALVFDIGPRVWWPSTLASSIERRLPRHHESEAEPKPEPAGAPR